MLLLFFKSLRYRWLEYLMAAIVVAAAIATLTVQRSLSASTEDQIHDLAHKLGKNMLVVPSETELSDFYALRYDSSAMPDSHPDIIQNSDLKRHISLAQSRLYANMEFGAVPLVFVGEKTKRRGRVSRALPRGGVMLGETASKRLGAKRSDSLEVNDLDLKVYRVLKKPPGGLDVGVFASLETAQEVLDRPGEINAMRLGGCWCRVDIPALASQVEELLPDTQAVTIAGMLKAQKGTIAEAKRYSAVTLAVAIFLIAGIVIALISSQVRRQVREIGLLLATGASPWLIVLMFTLTAALVGGLGGLAGHFLGFPLTAKVASSLIGLPLPASEGLLGATLALSIIVSTLSALVPAVRAARLDPTEVLREA